MANLSIALEKLIIGLNVSKLGVHIDKNGYLD